jgi:hypothetical protein
MTHPKKKQKGQKKGKKMSVGAEDPEEDVVERDVDEHPYQKGHYLVVRYRDNSHRLAKVFVLNICGNKK